MEIKDNSNKKEARVNIIGAGISGLIAALVLERNGISPVIYEASEAAGGRVSTDLHNGYYLDRGFQVLLEAYPKVQEYLDIPALNTLELWPGASIFRNGQQEIIGDPMRNLSLLWPTLKTKVASFSDKLKILRLNLELQATSLEDIFSGEDISTRDYLIKRGFSDKIIEQFFIPFFGGIYLEEELDTSCRMFKFVYKMFGQGNALIPEKGIGAVPDQLISKLNKTTIKYNRPVSSVRNGVIVFDDGTELLSGHTIIAMADPSRVTGDSLVSTQWQSSDTLYFECSERVIEYPLIGLISEREALINNIIYLPQPASSTLKAPFLLSVTIVKSHQLGGDELVKRVEEELSAYCGIRGLKFLKHYHIARGLPIVGQLKNELPLSSYRLDRSTYLAGDYLLNGSLNAAMTTGEGAANALIQDLNS